jgi:DNA-binding XRE family transcriptional regulator
MTLSIEQRGLLIEAVQQGIADGSLQIGEAVRRLRVEGAEMHQSTYARICKVSVRTLIQIEQGEGNPTLKSLNAVFRPFGLQMGVVRRPRRLS